MLYRNRRIIYLEKLTFDIFRTFMKRKKFNIIYSSSS